MAPRSAVIPQMRAQGYGTGTRRTEWAELVAGCQALVNTATAIQDVAITRVEAKARCVAEIFRPAKNRLRNVDATQQRSGMS